LQAPLSSPTQVEIEKLAGDLRFVGGLAWSRTGFLVASDTHRRTLYRFEAGARPRILKDNDGGVAGVSYDIQGRLYLCESDARRISRMDRQGAVEPFIENFEGKKFNAPNDIVVRRDGNVYFTDPAFGSAGDNRELDFYGIFHATPKGELSAVARWKTRPNGIALSANGSLLYVADSDRHAIVVFDIDRNGAAANQRDFANNVAGVPGDIQTDMNGRLYVAARGLSIYSAQGKLERTLFEDRNTSCIAFGESDGESLFVASRGDIFKAKMGVKGAFQY
jgi:gluconolactonase